MNEKEPTEQGGPPQEEIEEPAEQGGSPQETVEEEAAEEVSPPEPADEGGPPQEEIEEPAEQGGSPQEEVMVGEITSVEEEAKPQVKIRCTSKYTRVNKAGEELETYDDVPYGRDEDIYEVDEDLAKELLATKHFVPVK